MYILKLILWLSSSETHCYLDIFKYFQIALSQVNALGTFLFRTHADKNVLVTSVYVFHLGSSSVLNLL